MIWQLLHNPKRLYVINEMYKMNIKFPAQKINKLVQYYAKPKT